MRPDGPGGPDPEADRRREEERRRRRRERREDAADGAGDVAEAAGGCSVPTGCGGSGRSGGGRSSGAGSDGCGSGGGGGRGGGGLCDSCDGCNLLVLVHLSTVLAALAALVPDAGSGPLVRAAIHFYRRRLTRFTPVCPATPSCSAYALAAVTELGPRRGLRTAAHRIRHCGPATPARPAVPGALPAGAAASGPGDASHAPASAAFDG